MPSIHQIHHGKLLQQQISYSKGWRTVSIALVAPCMRWMSNQQFPSQGMAQFLLQKCAKTKSLSEGCRFYGTIWYSLMMMQLLALCDSTSPWGQTIRATRVQHLLTQQMVKNINPNAVKKKYELQSYQLAKLLQQGLIGKAGDLQPNHYCILVCPLQPWCDWASV